MLNEMQKYIFTVQSHFRLLLKQ